MSGEREILDVGLQFPIPEHINAIQMLTPASEANRLLTWRKGKYWNQDRDVLSHHEALFGAFAAVVERDVYNQVGDLERDQSRTLLEWVTGLRPKSKADRSTDPLRGQSIQDIAQYRLEGLRSFSENDLPKNLLATYRNLLRTLADTRWLILPEAQTMDPRLGTMRECTTVEKMSLLENLFRRNAQEIGENRLPSELNKA